MALSPSSSPTLIGRYELIRRLGSGAMGTVYVARDTILGRSVALKTFRSGVGASPSELARLRQRLLREARIAGLAVHPHVVTIYDVVDQGEQGFYIAMELVEGTNLQARLDAEGPLPLETTIELTRQIASALDHLHQRGVVHRDLKPANILLTDGGQVKITDFGIARPEDPGETQETAVFGTPQYMAPEQLQGRPADPRTDVFSLGILLYEMITGGKPFRGATVAEVSHSILYEAPLPLEHLGAGLPLHIARALDRALAKIPEERFTTAGELAHALAAGGPENRQQWELDTGATAALPHPSKRPGHLLARITRSSPRRWLPISISALLAAVGVVALALALTHDRRTVEGVAEDPEMERAYLRLLTEGQRLMAQGDPRAAAVLFTAAQGFSREHQEARVLRQEAMRLAEEQGVQLEVEEARQALAEGRYEEVIAAARSLLTTQAGHEQALKVLADVEAALARPPPAPEGKRASASTGTSPSPISAPVAPAEPYDVGDPFAATVALELEAQAPRGVVALYADHQQVLLESYDFYRRRAWLWKERHPGTLSRSVVIPAGTTALRVLVARPGEPARMLLHEASFGAGSSHRLEVTVPPEGEPESRLNGFDP